MTAFEPVGDQARWRQIYPLLLEKAPGEVMTYEEIAEVLDLDPVTDRPTLRQAFRRAAQEYERVDNRAVEAIPDVGYRVVEPVEHLRLAQQLQKKSGRSLKRGQSKIVHVDYTGMADEVRRSFEMTGRALSMLLEYNRRLDSRQARLEDALSGMTTRQDRSDAEVAALKARLARLEETPDA